MVKSDIQYSAKYYLYMTTTSSHITYLKDFLIQNSGAKDSNALCIDDGLVTSAERPGHLLLTVHYDGDAPLLHTDGHAMPSMQHKGKTL